MLGVPETLIIIKKKLNLYLMLDSYLYFVPNTDTDTDTDVDL